MADNELEGPARRSRAGKPAARAILLGMLGAGMLAATPLQAKVVTFPQTHPQVAVDVPDDWSVTYSSIGLEMRSPEKNSVVVANLFKNDKAGAQAWPSKARQAFEGAGVSFPGVATETKASTPTPSATGTDQFTFSGAPAVNFSGVIAHQAGPAPVATPSITTAIPGTGLPGALLRNSIPHKIVTYHDGVFDGKPTDLQLYIYSLTRDELFLIAQQSMGTDGRAIAIVYSVKAIR